MLQKEPAYLDRLVESAASLLLSWNIVVEVFVVVVLFDDVVLDMIIVTIVQLLLLASHVTLGGPAVDVDVVAVVSVQLLLLESHVALGWTVVVVVPGPGIAQSSMVIQPVV
jgi:hypothetical protein